MSVVTFVGGPLDLTRAAVETLMPRYSVTRARRTVGLAAEGASSIEGSLYADLGFFESVYRLATSYDGEGNEVFVYIWSHDTDSTPSEIKRLRKQVVALSNDKADLTSALDVARTDAEGWAKESRYFRDRLATEQGRLAAVESALSAKVPWSLVGTTPPPQEQNVGAGGAPSVVPPPQPSVTKRQCPKGTLCAVCWPK
jgi:hypothetical protein